MPRSRARSAFKLIAVLAASALIGVVVFIATFVLIPAGEPKPTWSAASGGPPPVDFLLVMYPASKAVPLREAPELTADSHDLLDRAVVNTLKESSSLPTEWITVQLPGKQLWVRRSDLSFTPAPGVDRQALFDAYIANDDKNHPGQFRHGSLTTTLQPDGSDRCTLRVASDDHEQKFVYDVNANSRSATPVAEYRVFGAAYGLMNLHIFVIAAAAAAIASACTLFAAWLLLRRKAAPPAAPSISAA
ncbi:MAG: hypothetical protein QM783_07530 [Phycisphaerales bacterium]